MHATSGGTSLSLRIFGDAHLCAGIERCRPQRKCERAAQRPATRKLALVRRAVWDDHDVRTAIIFATARLACRRTHFDARRIDAFAAAEILHAAIGASRRELGSARLFRIGIADRARLLPSDQTASRTATSSSERWQTLSARELPAPKAHEATLLAVGGGAGAVTVTFAAQSQAVCSTVSARPVTT